MRAQSRTAACYSLPPVTRLVAVSACFSRPHGDCPAADSYPRHLRHPQFPVLLRLGPRRLAAMARPARANRAAYLATPHLRAGTASGDDGGNRPRGDLGGVPSAWSHAGDAIPLDPASRSRRRDAARAACGRRLLIPRIGGDPRRVLGAGPLLSGRTAPGRGAGSRSVCGDGGRVCAASGPGAPTGRAPALGLPATGVDTSDAARVAAVRLAEAFAEPGWSTVDDRSGMSRLEIWAEAGRGSRPATWSVAVAG